MSESTTSLSSVSDKITENDSSYSSLSLTNEKQNSEPTGENSQTASQLINLESNSNSAVIVKDSENNLNIVPSSRSSKSNTGSWTLVDAKEFLGECIPEEIKTGESKSQGQMPQGQGQSLQGQGQNLNILTSRNRADSDGKQGKILSTISNLTKMKFGKRQISEPGFVISKSSGDTVYCSRCKMVS